jgi:hypothetical protein
MQTQLNGVTQPPISPFQKQPLPFQSFIPQALMSPTSSLASSSMSSPQPQAGSNATSAVCNPMLTCLNNPDQLSLFELYHSASTALQSSTFRNKTVSAPPTHLGKPAARRRSKTEPIDEADDDDDTPRQQALRSADDLYTPQWVRFKGTKKQGLCDLCKGGQWFLG